jgi:hypothetical protein
MIRNIITKIIGAIAYGCGYIVGFIKGIYIGAVNAIHNN